MAFCPNCGTEVQPGANFCVNCGAAVGAAASNSAAAGNSAYSNAANSDSSYSYSAESSYGTGVLSVLITDLGICRSSDAQDILEDLLGYSGSQARDLVRSIPVIAACNLTHDQAQCVAQILTEYGMYVSVMSGNAYYPIESTAVTGIFDSLGGFSPAALAIIATLGIKNQVRYFERWAYQMPPVFAPRYGRPPVPPPHRRGIFGRRRPPMAGPMPGSMPGPMARPKPAAAPHPAHHGPAGGRAPASHEPAGRARGGHWGDGRGRAGNAEAGRREFGSERPRNSSRQRGSGMGAKMGGSMGISGGVHSGGRTGRGSSGMGGMSKPGSGGMGRKKGSGGPGGKKPGSPGGAKRH